MPSSIGVNLRVTGHCSQGGRKYMEDMFSVAYQRTEDERDLEYAFFGIFDGHGGQQAATYAKEHLLENIVNQKSFWSDKDAEVLRAIREGFLQTHLAMWRQLDHWPKTSVGFPSTSGTTASIAFIRRGKIYIGHVGDSAIVLGSQDGDGPWRGIPLTRYHKPESEEESQRIEQAGGKVVKKLGVARVVWNRPRLNHKGPVRRSTHMDEIPFLAIARSLGDLWSYNPALDVFVVSPEPDVTVHTIDVNCHRCLIFGTDGLWTVVSPNDAVAVVQAAESRNEMHLLGQATNTNNGNIPHAWVNPSKSLVDHALKVWRSLGLQADNTSVVTLMLDPPGPPRVQVLMSQRQQQQEEFHNTNISREPESNVEVPEQSSEYISPEDLTPFICTRICDSASQPDSSCGAVCASTTNQSSLPSSPVSLVCVQSNEVSSSSSASASSCQSMCTTVKPMNKASNHGKPLLDPILRAGFISNMPNFKRRHSSSIPQPVVSTIEKRKRTRSEHDLSKEKIMDEDLGASDAENDRVTWPPWAAAQKSSTARMQPRSCSKFQTPTSGKSVLPASPKNSNAICPSTPDSSTISQKRTLRSRNSRADGQNKVRSETKVLVHTPVTKPGHLISVHRAQRRTLSRVSQPTSMCTRSKGRQHSSRSK